MTELLDFYSQQAKQAFSAEPWLQKLQSQALSALAEQGFPDRKNEDWKYTQVESLLKQEYQAAVLSASGTSTYKSDAPVTNQITLVNGVVADMPLALQQQKGVIICSLAEALERHSDKLQSHLNAVLKHQHGFQSLNTAMLEAGVFIYLPENCQIEQPLLLAHWQDKDKQAVYLRHLVVLEKNASLNLLEDYAGAQDCHYFSNTLTEVKLHAGAQLSHYKFQRESKSALHIAHIEVEQAADSTFNSHSLSLGGQMVRSDIQIHLSESGAQCLMNGVYLPGDGQHIDHHTTVLHQAAHCSSAQDYKGVLDGHSRAVFNGKVVVAKDAQKTQAAQQNKNLLLSEKAEIDSKPQLEIYADDVRCSHGATVGQLDEEALFYLATRGIDKALATQILVQAFAAENIETMPDASLSAWAIELISQQLGYGHGN